MYLIQFPDACKNPQNSQFLQNPLVFGYFLPAGFIKSTPALRGINI